ncbi:MAG TPA: tetratricopeptide repeat protein [Candidatus Baltobacteraceae bacterium]|jgi:lipoprotein NlpI
MSLLFIRLVAAALCIAAVLVQSRAYATAGPAPAGNCVVPKRLHLTDIIFAGVHADATLITALTKRLQKEDFDAVGKSVPDHFSDLGWLTVDVLENSGYAPAAVLETGGTTGLIDEGIRQEFLHAEEVRPQMECDRAIATYPNEALPRTARAAIELKSGNFSAAASDYSVAIATEPESKTARYGRALAYYRLGKYAQAQEDANYAVGSDVGNAYTLRALIREALGDDDLATADAASALKQFKANQIDGSSAQYALAAAYSNLGYFSAAIAAFDAVLQQQPSQPYVLEGRGAAYFSKGDSAKAIRDFTEASRAPNGQRAFLELAVVKFSIGDVSMALKNAKRAYETNPNDAYAALWLVVASRSLHLRAPAVAAKAATLPKWPAPVIRAYLGAMPFSALEAAAVSSSPFTARMQLCEARFYSGVHDLQSGRNDRGRELLRLAKAQCPFAEAERAAAAAILRSESP